MEKIRNAKCDLKDNLENARASALAWKICEKDMYSYIQIFVFKMLKDELCL